MKISINSGLFFFIVCIASIVGANGQNRFEGQNIFVDAMETQTPGSPSCAVRYVPPTTPVTVTDLDPKTPLKINACGGTDATVRQLNATTAVINASQVNYKWCFTGEDKSYRISFEGDKFAGAISYTWITEDEREAGFYNVRDFGARGDGKTDDTIAIRSALAFAASRNGGTIRFPNGDYIVGNVPNFKGLTLPSGVIIEGAGSVNTGGLTNYYPNKSASRIRLQGTNKALFRIGECTQRVAVRDIELISDSKENTYGVEAVGAFISSQDFYFERVAFTNFHRGIYAHALAANNKQWQFDFVKVEKCLFLGSRDAAVWIDLWNTDWTFRGDFFFTPNKEPNQAANGLYITHAGMILIEDTFGGPGPGAKGGDFIHIAENGNLSVINSQCESMTRSLVFGEEAGAGNLSYPITLVNNIFGNPIEIKARRMLVSTGNLFLSNTVNLAPDVQVYSTGDRFCYDGSILGCQITNPNANFNGGKIIFSTGQPADGAVSGRAAIFGTEVQMSNFAFDNLPGINADKNNGSMVYCSNCRRATTPCQTGGTGAPAMIVNNQWSCL